MPEYAPKKGIFQGRVFESRSAYRHALARTPGHGEAKYKASYQKEQLRTEQPSREQVESRHVQHVRSEAQNYEHPNSYQLDYFARQSVLSEVWSNDATARYMLSDLYLQAVKENWDTRAHGAYAQLLEAAGMREEDADYDVGKTPGRE